MIETCRHCHSTDTIQFLDLGFAPPSNAYISESDTKRPEMYFPLKLFSCRNCRLVQTVDFAKADELFTHDYAYFSSTSSSWVEHARQYSQKVIERFNLSNESYVVEIASNDGYLLKNFVEAEIPCLGVEPTQSTADAARLIGIDVLEEFFGEALAKRIEPADLIIGNNVYAHVPDINDFTKGLACGLKPEGVVTLEFPHLLNLVKKNQFDTVYHEHYSYLSLLTVERIFAKNGLRIFDVEKIPTHGGSLRIYGCLDGANHQTESAVARIREEEYGAKMHCDAFYTGFQDKAEQLKNRFLEFLLEAKAQGLTVAGYGAAAKGNTLMNFAGVKPDLISFVCDAAEAKIGKYLPGSHIPILSPEYLKDTLPDVLILFPWNIAEEISEALSQHSTMRKVVFVPDYREIS